jgi:hypothetical protein
VRADRFDGALVVAHVRADGGRQPRVATSVEKAQQDTPVRAFLVELDVDAREDWPPCARHRLHPDELPVRAVHGA